MIKTSGISFSYNAESTFKYPDIFCNSGEGLIIIGKSGCGKTTLLHIVAGLLQPNAGSVMLNQTSLYQLKNTELDTFRGKQIGIVFQKPQFINALTIYENIKIASHNKASDAHIQQCCNQLSIEHILHKKPNKVSVGELQRSSIARAIVNKPSLILADEPTSNLDDENAFIVIQLLKQQAKANNSCLIVVTHDQRIKIEFDNQIVLT